MSFQLDLLLYVIHNPISRVVWLISVALVTRAQVEGGTRLKTAAALTASGDLGVVVRTIWQGDGSDRERLMQKVTFLIYTTDLD